MRIVLCLLSLLSSGLLSSCAVRAETSRPMRALWVTRFDYRTEADVRTIIANTADAGFDTVLFQVRGNATAFYRSAHEPWAEQLGGEDPGFDPLELAISLARERGVQLHAWINVMPAWWGTEPPSDPNHVYNRHPEWLWYDQSGQRQAFSEKFYVSLNPCLPEVRAYLIEVVDDLVSRYDLDGLHLDYIRFPNEPPATPAGSEIDYPRDARTVSLYREAAGREPERGDARWNAWRSDAVTELVRGIRAKVKAHDDAILVSAAVGSVPERALEHFQDVETWLESRLLDLVFPMNYTSDLEEFDRRCAFWKGQRATTRVVMGLMLTGDDAVRREQMKRAAASFGDVCAFAYHTLFDSRNDVIATQDAGASEERARRRAALLPITDLP